MYSSPVKRSLSSHLHQYFSNIMVVGWIQTDNHFPNVTVRLYIIAMYLVHLATWGCRTHNSNGDRFWLRKYIFILLIYWLCHNDWPQSLWYSSLKPWICMKRFLIFMKRTDDYLVIIFKLFRQLYCFYNAYWGRHAVHLHRNNRIPKTLYKRYQ